MVNIVHLLQFLWDQVPGFLQSNKHFFQLLSKTVLKNTCICDKDSHNPYLCVLMPIAMEEMLQSGLCF